LVRNDMLLTAFIFFTGWIILEKLRTETVWIWKDRLALCLLLFGSMLTKGRSPMLSFCRNNPLSAAHPEA
jgi:hypothetical protein